MYGEVQCKDIMMLSWKMELGGWWTLHLEPNLLDASGYIRTSIKYMGHLENKKRDLQDKGYAHKEGVDYT